MFVSKKYLSRRTLLRGAGSAISLPQLDSMGAAGTALAQTAARPQNRFAPKKKPHRPTNDKMSPRAVGTQLNI
jgi:hypothetical protein